MRCSYDASLGEPVERVWARLCDVDRVATALPGATLTRDGDAVSGSIRCSVASAQITYRVSARATLDNGACSAVVSIDGEQARGDGTLAARLTVAASPSDGGCLVAVRGDVDATGRAESADAAAWSRVLGRLVDAALAAPADGESPGPVASESAAARARSGDGDRPSPRPALSVAPDLDEYAAPAWTDRVNLKVVGPVLAGVVLLMRRRRKRRRAAQGEESE